MLRAVDTAQENHRLGHLGSRIVRAAGVVGILGALASLILAAVVDGGVERFFRSYLVNFAYFLSLALGALFFVLLQHLTRAGWSVVVRRLAEGIAGNVLLMALLFLPILFGMHYLFHWTHVEAADDPLLQGKLVYLNEPFFIVRWIVYFSVWGFLARFFFTRSVRQDETGGTELTLQMQKMSAPGMILFALTLSFAAFDLLMSINAHWYSTIFGVYYFSGSALGFFALLALIAMFLQSKGRLTRSITVEHLHDLGKLVFAFVFFWAYIAFSQYMLIWYGNIPEETEWYLHRQTGSWTAVSLAILFGHFFLPFLGLISRIPKRRRATLWAGTIWILFIHWMDIYWLAMPEWNPQGLSLHVLDLTGFLAVGGLFVAAAARRLQHVSLVPMKDPRISESLLFENY